MSKVNIFKPVEQKSRSAAPAPPTDSAAFHAVVDSRRSVRVYADDPIPESVMEACMDAALKAPNSSNLQTWEIHHVVDAAKKAALVEACLSQPAAGTAPELLVFVGRPDLWRRNNQWMLEAFDRAGTVPESAYQYYRKITPLVYDQGAFGWRTPFKWWITRWRGLRKPIPREPIGKWGMRIWAHKSTALACAQFMLAMRAHGFDTCPMEGMDSARVKRLLGLPRQAVVTMVISAGKRAEGGVYGAQQRFDRKHFIHRH
ncbi:MAG TPA: nitroreductase family protein [Flavobacteriales bacterium]|jgi:nitroreductase|nr:nitroreductase family protein [Flavobacteriales bacterium]